MHLQILYIKEKKGGSVGRWITKEKRKIALGNEFLLFLVTVFYLMKQLKNSYKG